jgi:methionine-gamma-lyase
MSNERQRPDKHDPSTVGEATWAVHGGNLIDASTGAIRTPLIMANSYQLPDDPTTADWSVADRLVYARNGHFNQQQLELKLAAMDGGEDACVFATGVAALHGLFFSLLTNRDHIVVSNITYEAVHRLFTELLPERYGIEATLVDSSDLDAIRAAIRPNTRLIHTEVVANPTTRVADIAGLAAIAHEAGALLSVDSTYTPPVFYRPIEDGADIVIHSLTKYINGHGDAMGGVVIGSREVIDKVRFEALVDVGGSISPFNAWQIMRGSVTLPLRFQQHLKGAEQVAAFLDADPRIAYVAYPGLENHPQHQIAKRQFRGKGYGAMMAFSLDGDPTMQNAFVKQLRVITSAVSLGHDETLIVHVGARQRGGSENYPPEFLTYGHNRLSIGLEDPDDLIADLQYALDEIIPE